MRAMVYLLVLMLCMTLSSASEYVLGVFGSVTYFL